jgi:hypothetical protein
MATTAISPSSSSANPGLSNLLQTLENVDGPLASSPGLQAALANAPASDLVELSVAATQLQNVSALFGNSSSTANPFGAGTNESDFANLENVLTGSSASGSAAALQLQNEDTLLGIQDGSAANNPATSLDGLLGGTSASPSALQSITSALTAATASSSTNTSSSQAAQLAEFQQQIQNTQNLFGIGSSSATNSTLNLLA